MTEDTPHWMLKTDRSRITAGMCWCERRRYLTYHAENGYGIVLRRQSIPLAQGIHVHRALERIIKQRVAHGPVPLTHWRGEIQRSIETYQKSVRASGIYIETKGLEEAGAAAHAEHEFTIIEQSHLLECLLWGFVRVLLEPLLEEFDVIEVEEEAERVEGCTCGVEEDWNYHAPEEHRVRGCQGIVIMSRPDLILKQKSSGEYVNADFKTTGWLDDSRWRNMYEDNVQFAIGSACAEQRLGVQIPHSFVIALGKGRRSQTWDTITKSKSGPYRQDHWLCYAYYKPATPTMDEEWQLKYDYVDQDGYNRKATESKGYSKIPIWEAEIGDPAEGVSPAEAWVLSLPKEVLETNFCLIGPFQHPRHLVESYFRGVVATERRISENLWKLYDLKQQLSEEGVTHPELDDRYIALLDATFPQSRDCRRFNRKCELLPICNREPGWVNPTEEMGYKLRRPHHVLELQEMEELGLEIPPDDEDLEDESDD